MPHTIELTHRTFFCVIATTFIGLLFISCSTPERVAILIPPTNIDTTNYLNAEDYGYNLEIKPDQTNFENVDSSFTPLSFKGGVNNALREHFQPPRAGIKHSRGGKIRLELYVDSTGTLIYSKPINATSIGWENVGANIVKKSTYVPATLNGKPVNSIRRITFNFTTKRVAVPRRVY